MLYRKGQWNLYSETSSGNFSDSLYTCYYYIICEIMVQDFKKHHQAYSLEHRDSLIDLSTMELLVGEHLECVLSSV